MSYTKKEIAQLALGGVAIAGSALASGELGKYMYEVFVGPAGKEVFYVSVVPGAMISKILVYDAILWSSLKSKKGN